jgi:hypothetical protein
MNTPEVVMRVDVRGLAVAGAVLVGGSWFVVGLVNVFAPNYGLALLEVAAAMYPGYHGPAGFGSVLVATLYGLVDGAVGGAVLAWVYNRVTARAA